MHYLDRGTRQCEFCAYLFNSKIIYLLVILNMNPLNKFRPLDLHKIQWCIEHEHDNAVLALVKVRTAPEGHPHAR